MATQARRRDGEHRDNALPFRRGHRRNKSIWLSLALANRAEIAKARGEDSIGTASLEEAEHIQRTLRFAWGLSDTLRISGDFQRDRGWIAAALRGYRECLALFEEHQDTRLLTDAVTGIAIAMASLGRSAQAARLLSASAALRELNGLSIKAWVRESYDRAEVAIRGALSTERWADEWAAGAVLSTARKLSAMRSWPSMALGRRKTRQRPPE